MCHERRRCNDAKANQRSYRRQRTDSQTHKQHAEHDERLDVAHAFYKVGRHRPQANRDGDPKEHQTDSWNTGREEHYMAVHADAVVAMDPALSTPTPSNVRPPDGGTALEGLASAWHLPSI